MLRFIRPAALVAALAVLTTGCFEDLAGPYDGPPLVEFAQVEGGYTAVVPDAAGTVTLTVNLIAPPQGSPVTVGVAVGGSASEGTHYTFPEGAQVTIPANSNFGELPINILDGDIPAGETVELELELTESQDGSVEGAENLDDFTLAIEGV